MGGLRRFLLPKLTRGFLVRAAIVAFAAYAVFGHVITPVLISGRSMEPTYRDGRVNFCNRLSRVRGNPRHGDVVCIRLAGKRRMLLKRVVALAGQTVEFRDGTLLVDGMRADEPYVKTSCDWNLAPRKVEPGSVYVVGDNRAVPMDEHVFGQGSMSRIEGAPLW